MRSIWSICIYRILFSVINLLYKSVSGFPPEMTTHILSLRMLGIAFPITAAGATAEDGSITM